MDGEGEGGNGHESYEGEDGTESLSEDEPEDTLKVNVQVMLMIQFCGTQ